nr:hypothetical protein [Roseovarius aestuarii]
MGTKTVDRHQKQLIVVYRLPLIPKIVDTPGRFSYHTACTIVTRRLRQIDHIVEPVDHIKIMARHQRVDQRLVGATRVDHIEAYRRAFKPVVQLPAR